MFLKNSRVERKNGIRFYEQDIMTSEYLFTSDLIVELEIDYFSPGAGIVLLEDQESTIDKVNNAYIFKIGVNDFTVIHKYHIYQDTVLHVSNNIAPPKMGLKLTFVKTGRMVELLSGDRSIGHYMLPKHMDRYHLGFYSNAGNVFKTASIASGMPNNWIVNIKNTNGGRIFFYKDGFNIENCEYDAEIEQPKVFLPKGRYHLTYDKNEIDGKNDITSYVFLSEDERFNDEKKNLLDENNVLILEEDSHVNIKFKGTSGGIQNISIKSNIKDVYVSTGASAVTTAGSEMVIDLDGLKMVQWKGVVESIPEYESYTDVRDYGIIATKERNYLIDEFGLVFEMEYLYKLDVEEMKLDVFVADTEELHKTIYIALTDEDDNKLSVFKNINGFINEIIIRRVTGEEINVLLQKTSKIYVPAAIKGPIVITDRDYIPLELSSSHRESDGLYVFTNWERELFDITRPIRLENPIANISGNIRVYGILPDAILNPDKILTIQDEIDSIDLYADKYEIITEDNFLIDYYGNKIYLSDEVKERYKEIVIDYLKDDSYCINYIEELHVYEVDISTTKEAIYVMYDYLTQDSDDQGAITEYQITDIKPGPTNKYVVLRKN